MQKRQEKRRMATLAAAGLVGMALLAAAMERFTFAAPRVLRETQANRIGFSETTALHLFLAWLLLLALPMIYMMYHSPQYRRWILWTLLLSPLLVYAIAITKPTPLRPAGGALDEGTAELLQGALATVTPTPAALEIGVLTANQALTWLLSLGLAVLILTLAITAYWFASRSRAVSSLEIIAASVETARQALAQGGDAQAAILRCYAEMLAAANARGANRPGYLTPAEFIQRMVQVGLPGGAVERLTHLFEVVRYSPQPPTVVMEAEAMDCLQAIAQAAKEHL